MAHVAAVDDVVVIVGGKDVVIVWRILIGNVAQRVVSGNAFVRIRLSRVYHEVWLFHLV